MRKAILVLSIMSCALTGADARGRHHHGRHFDMYLQARLVLTRPLPKGSQRGAVDVSDWPWSLQRTTCRRKGPLTQHKSFLGTGIWSPPTQTATGNVLYRRMARVGSNGTE